MPYNANAVANYFLELAEEAEASISPMKLQKMVYFAHGWCLALLDELLVDEQIEAWRFGPVIRSLYGQFKHFGNMPITERAKLYKLLPGEKFRLKVTTPAIPDSPEAAPVRDLLDRVWEVYSPFTAIQLSNMTHQQGTPWRQVMDAHNGEPPKGTDIPAKWIRGYFAAMTK